MVKGDHLGISVLLDSDYVEQFQVVQQQPDVNIPSVERFKGTIDAFKESLVVTVDAAQEIERNTREQHLSSAWFQARRYCLTASRFGEIISRKPNTGHINVIIVNTIMYCIVLIIISTISYRRTTHNSTYI